MERIREIVETLVTEHGLSTDRDCATDVAAACALAEFCDAVRQLDIADEPTRAEAHVAEKQIAACVIARLLPEIGDALSARLADRRISEAA